MKFNVKSLFKKINIKSFLAMNFGLLLSSIATVMFISPSSLVAGGTTGLSILIQSLTHVPYYVYMYGFNTVLIIVSFFALGKEFAIKTIYGSLMIPTFGALLSFICKWCNIDISTYLSGVESIYIIAIASVLMGLGVGISIKNGGSTGGFDILEAIFLKYFHIPYSVSMYILDALLVVSGGILFNPETTVVFKTGIAEAFGAILYIFIDGFIVDIVTFGGYNKRAVFITSSKYEEISNYIVHSMARGVTYLDSQGGFSRVEGKMLVCVCYSREYFMLRDAIQAIDPNAFIFVSKATEVRGLGFNYETEAHLESRKTRKK